MASIEDRACGIPQEFWALGEQTSGKTGQFHEGMKLAALVLAREGWQVRLETVGYTGRPSLDRVEASLPT